MNRSKQQLSFALMIAPALWCMSTAWGASSFSDSLQGFTGSSTETATQSAVSSAGFNFFDHDFTSQVLFDSSGAKFGDGQPDAIGRNYMRTNDTDYANVSFVAEVTFVTPNIEEQDVYIGLGAGNANVDFFRVPDYLTPVSSVLFWGETELETPTVEIVTAENGRSSSVFVDPATGLGNGTHRLRLDFDWFRKEAEFSFDFDYAGGPFTADVTAPPVNVLSLYGADGWPTEPARIWFGGDEGAVFQDFEVNVSTPSMLMGDFDSSGTITAADWAIFRANLHTNLSNRSFMEAYFLGDLNADRRNDHDDYIAFKVLYDDANGAGAFAAMLAGVPEPSALALGASIALCCIPRLRRAPIRIA